MRSHPDAVQFLSAHSPFVGLEPAAMKLLASRCRLRSRQLGESLFREGKPCRDLYILIAGRVKCVRASPEGREQILNIFDRPGDVFARRPLSPRARIS
jgi:CRP-like cAMP-binding protein